MAKNHKKRLTEHSFFVKHKEQMRFLLVGGTNTVIDFAIYGLLVNVLGLFVVFANMISTVIVLSISFTLNYKFVWESKKSKRETAPKFAAISLFTAWVIQSGLIFLIVTMFGSDETVNLIAKLVGICVGTICNFFGYRYIFR